MLGCQGQLGHGPPVMGQYTPQFYSLHRLFFASVRFIDCLPCHPDVKQTWQDYTEHMNLSENGRLMYFEERFRVYFIQDYLSLTHFTRINALAAHKEQINEHDTNLIADCASCTTGGAAPPELTAKNVDFRRYRKRERVLRAWLTADMSSILG